MKKTVQLQVLIAVLAAGMMFSSCGNIDIIKRKYRPGFHVDITKKRQKTQVAEQAEVADVRKAEEIKTTESNTLSAADVDEEIMFTADVAEATPAIEKEAKPLELQKEKKVKMKEVLRSEEFENMTFARQMRTIQNSLLGAKPSPAAGDTHWMAWVSFGTGIGAAAFGLISLIVAFFWIALWPTAIVLGAAAIVFALIHKKKGYAGERFRKLGFLFGLIGAGLGLVAMIIWIVAIATGAFGARRGRYYRRW